MSVYQTNSLLALSTSQVTRDFLVERLASRLLTLEDRVTDNVPFGVPLAGDELPVDTIGWPLDLAAMFGWEGGVCLAVGLTISYVSW